MQSRAALGQLKQITLLRSAQRSAAQLALQESQLAAERADTNLTDAAAELAAARTAWAASFNRGSFDPVLSTVWAYAVGVEAGLLAEAERAQMSTRAELANRAANYGRASACLELAEAQLRRGHRRVATDFEAASASNLEFAAGRQQLR